MKTNTNDLGVAAVQVAVILKVIVGEVIVGEKVAPSIVVMLMPLICDGMVIPMYSPTLICTGDVIVIVYDPVVSDTILFTEVIVTEENGAGFVL